MNLNLVLSFCFGVFIGWFFSKLYNALTPKQKNLIKTKFNNVAGSVEGKK